MTVLPKNRLLDKVRTNQSNYSLVIRHNDWAVYARNHGVDYEVFKIRKLKPAIMFKKEYPAREAFPSSEEFGDDAWSVVGLGCRKRALDLFQQIIKDVYGIWVEVSDRYLTGSDDLSSPLSDYPKKDNAYTAAPLG